MVPNGTRPHTHAREKPANSQFKRPQRRKHLPGPFSDRSTDPPFPSSLSPALRPSAASGQDVLGGRVPETRSHQTQHNSHQRGDTHQKIKSERKIKAVASIQTSFGRCFGSTPSPHTGQQGSQGPKPAFFPFLHRN